ncbi:methionine--tRNA ligase [Brevibacterium sp. 91QC2O2]|uniref:methionine--tRNA ligase n=1 Tax=Brevibacterium sp. 91QC2O2 TaxID=2968458 RepID=UPI00211B92D9|nr:methionine--tRNA ligase [Brevibacterium sp. 91QC2O2]MCQ9367474.1 methionine--tRNA ligase [Brevibacterium sp. 91QC2O2]
MSFYITTAIAYPNGTPHIGHAYEYVAADTIARFHRLDGEDVFFMTGTDEHGLKMQQTAQKQGVTAMELATANAAAFRTLQDTLGSSYNRFIRTTDADHVASCQAIWQRMEENGDIYLDSYAGWYSVRDEAYYNEDETEVREDGQRYATATGTEVTWTEEESYFFRLSAYQDKLLALYAEHPEFVGPDVRRNEVASFVSGGLNDLSISRTTFDWGIPVPGDEKHVMYVWVDALTNYLTGVGYPNVDGEAFKKFWPADVHIIGKDIVRFHAVYWPAFLMSAGIELPKRVHAHGFLFNKGEKMSKSIGNVVDPYDLVDSFGLDAMRFFLLREISYGNDGSYSAESIIGRKNSDLANEYGNLAQRSLSMVNKNLGGIVPDIAEADFTEADRALLDQAAAAHEAARGFVATQELNRYVEVLWKVLEEANRYFSAQEPWKFKKTDPARMATVLYTTIEVVRQVSILVQPVMPESAGKVLDLLGVPAVGSAGGRDDNEATHVRSFAALATPLAAGVELPKPTGVFPRYEAPKDDAAAGSAGGQKQGA